MSDGKNRENGKHPERDVHQAQPIVGNMIADCLIDTRGEAILHQLNLADVGNPYLIRMNGYAVFPIEKIWDDDYVQKLRDHATSIGRFAPPKPNRRTRRTATKKTGGSSNK